MRTRMGLKVKLKLAVDVHGPSQLLRAASKPSCVRRQSRAALDPWSSNSWIPEATAGSFASAGLKMKARSFEYPSPLTSPAIIGVNGAPDRNWPYQFTFTVLKAL